MIRHNTSDTIAAISTPVGEAGIGIVRMSGKEALVIADKIFLSKDGKKPSDFKTYTTHYGWVVDKTETIDEVILTVMRAPKSYTREDIVEINCHGGIVSLRRVLEVVLENGCRLAEPGEFTRRAFLNGRIDLTQAEAVLDIIRAKTESALKIGAEQLRGRLSSQLNNLRNDLLEILAVLEANIDFPEEEIGSFNPKEIAARLGKIKVKFKEILETSKRGEIFREGIRAVICGSPNVGKSSFLNALLKKERSIVSPVPGTTRDTIEEIIDIKGIPVRIVDTAGIIEPRDLIEKKAVLRSRRYIRLADLVILIFDGSERLTKEDEALIRRLRKKTVLAIINKIDLKQKINKEKLKPIFHCLIEISAKKSRNINLIEEAIADLIYDGKVNSPESILVSNLRHTSALKDAEKLVEETLHSLDNKLSLEFIAQDIKDALDCLDEIVGRKFSVDLLERIFNDFCIGK